ncbi:Kelch repeat-containing protein [Chitinophaga alhagiae]|uniref:Kelch repeat-containing protein n=1 Tax=Chitinophaga alhagiae TaxID=2203219 RepID=UPI0013008E74|nr:kelch repeat-containing protein [Chitinophaga alhagiae]
MHIARNYGWILVGLLAACSKSDSTDDETGNWVEVSEMSGKPRSEAVAFAIGDTAYIGTGYDGEKYLRDFWKYTPSRGWSQVNDLPAEAAVRGSAAAFVINNVAYVGTGFDGLNRLNDLWAYSPATGNWAPKAPLAGPNPAISLARRDAVGFALKGMGYIATGNDGGALKDVWQYDPVKDEWNERQSFGGSKRTEAVAFVIADKAYIVTGTNNAEYKSDFYVYDADEDNWTKKRDVANLSDEDYDNDYDIVRSNAVAFVMNNKGYVATGTKGGLSAHTWEYDPVADQWTKRRDFEGVARTGACSFTLGGKGYVLAGRTSSLPLDDIYRFEPDQEYNEND